MFLLSVPRLHRDVTWKVCGKVFLWPCRLCLGGACYRAVRVIWIFLTNVFPLTVNVLFANGKCESFHIIPSLRSLFWIPDSSLAGLIIQKTL